LSDVREPLNLGTLLYLLIFLLKFMGSNCPGGLVPSQILVTTWLPMTHTNPLTLSLLLTYTPCGTSGTDEMVDMNEFAKLAMSFAGKDLPLKHIPGPEGVRGRNSDNTMIRVRARTPYSQNLAPTITLTIKPNPSRKQHAHIYIRTASAGPRLSVSAMVFAKLMRGSRARSNV
jgi:hypothetical protein